MQASLSFWRYVIALLAVLASFWALPLAAQQQNYIAADLVAEAAPVEGETLTVALRFRPQEGWHGYWSNPGEAGLGMELDWNLPAGWVAGEPLYPVPERLILFDIVNHAYERDYTVLVPITVPEQAAVAEYRADHARRALARLFGRTVRARKRHADAALPAGERGPARRIRFAHARRSRR